MKTLQPPHRRNVTTLYRANYWRLKILEGKMDKTKDDKLDIAHLLSELDGLWLTLSKGQRRELDPVPETTFQSGANWIKMEALMCPHCGTILHMVAPASHLPRCSVCMLDINIMSDLVRPFEAEVPA